MAKIGIFGGSFNPIHTGHIALATQLRRTAGLDEVWLMVSPQNPLKRQDDLLADDLRLQMARQAVSGVEGVTVCDYEMRLPKPSYTWNTLQALRRDYPAHRFTLLIGGDNWACFEQWRHWQDILREFDVVVYPREGHPGTVEAALLPVSSTDIRQRVRQGKPVDGLVPDSIITQVKTYYR